MDGKLYEIVCGHGFNKGNCPHILRKQWSCGECTSARYIERIRQVKPTEEKQEEKQEEKVNTDKND